MGKVLHASGSGYFINCIEESADSIHAVWTLENAIKTYWRVRSWNFSASGTAEGIDSPYPWSFSFNNIASPYTNEEQLVCGGGFSENDPDVDIEYAFIEFGQVKKVGNLYNAGFLGYAYAGIAGVECSFSSIFSFTEVTSTLSVFGGVLPVGGQTLAGADTILSITEATLTPTEWWSYGGTYDTSTGARL
jgi:hypothetical protein